MRAARQNDRIVARLIGALADATLLGTTAYAQAPAPVQPPQTDGQAPSGDLSRRLDRSQGVIAPDRNVDPQMQVAPPDPNPGTMPVIPPPGSPGGDQRVQPK